MHLKMKRKIRPSYLLFNNTSQILEIRFTQELLKFSSSWFTMKLFGGEVEYREKFWANSGKQMDCVNDFLAEKMQL